MRKSILVLLIVLAAAPIAAAQTVFVVRHAERADAATGGAAMMAADPELSKAGRVRAEALAATLKDAGIAAIFATEYRRTQQTAAPLAKLLGLTVQPVPSKDQAGLIAKVKAVKGNVLVIGHSNTVPVTIKALGIDAAVTVGEADFDNLFVVTLGAQPSLVRLHFR